MTRRRRYVRDILTLPSRAKWLLWRMLHRMRAPMASDQIRVTVRNGPRIVVRHGTEDVSTAHEVFIEKHYESELLSATEGDWIIDLGANVGYATVDFACRWTGCRILSVEPIPAHLAQLQEHIRLNGIEDRVKVMPVAAGVTNGSINLVPDGVRTRRGTGEMNELTVREVDIFQVLNELGAIALLKMEIEGGEFPLLNDHRFRDIRSAAIILEWHGDAGVERARDTVVDRLTQAGYEVRHERANAPHGILFATIADPLRASRARRQ